MLKYCENKGRNYSSGGIGEALKRSASSLRAGGNDIDQSIGLIAGAM